MAWFGSRLTRADFWLKPEAGSQSSEPGLTADDLQRAAEEVDSHFGTVHAALNTGWYDEQLVKVGLTGAPGNAKKKGLLAAIGRYFKSSKEAVRDSLARLRGGLAWGATIVGSITTALREELGRVPGAASAGETIREFLEVLSKAAEASKKALPATGPKSTRASEVRES